MLNNPDIDECLDEAIRLYQIAEEQGGQVSFNIAKC